MWKERKQVFRVCYLVRARAMAHMARINFVCVTVIICLHSNLKIFGISLSSYAQWTVVYIAVNSTGQYIDHYIL